MGVSGNRVGGLQKQEFACIFFFVITTFLASYVLGLTVDQVLVSTNDIFLKLRGRGWQAVA